MKERPDVGHTLSQNRIAMNKQTMAPYAVVDSLSLGRARGDRATPAHRKPPFTASAH